MSQKKEINRWQFLKKTTAVAAGAIGFPYVVQAIRWCAGRED